MADRKQHIEEFLSDLRSLRRATLLKGAAPAETPRITPSQWGVLMHIEHQGKSTVKDLAHSLGITSSAATQLVDGLVESGYLTRQTSPEDRRVVTLALSKTSKNKIGGMKKQALQKLLKIFEVLNDREFDQYMALNKKITQAALPQKTI